MPVLTIDVDDNPHLAEYDGVSVRVLVPVGPSFRVKTSDGTELLVAEHELTGE